MANASSGFEASSVDLLLPPCSRTRYLLLWPDRSQTEVSRFDVAIVLTSSGWEEEQPGPSGGLSGYQEAVDCVYAWGHVLLADLFDE